MEEAFFVYVQNKLKNILDFGEWWLQNSENY